MQVLYRCKQLYILHFSLLTSSVVAKTHQMRRPLDPESYQSAEYLRAVGGWRQRKSMAQFRTGSHWFAVETDRWGPVVNRHERVCRRCGSGQADDEQHMIFHCSSLESIRLRHPTLFIGGTVSLAEFFAAEIASFVFGCKEECSRVWQCSARSRWHTHASLIDDRWWLQQYI